jgi:hypothetical protein
MISLISKICQTPSQSRTQGGTDQVPETALFCDLYFGTFDGGALGNDLGDRLSANPMSQ